MGFSGVNFWSRDFLGGFVGGTRGFLGFWFSPPFDHPRHLKLGVLPHPGIILNQVIQLQSGTKGTNLHRFCRNFHLINWHNLFKSPTPPSLRQTANCRLLLSFLPFRVRSKTLSESLMRMEKNITSWVISTVICFQRLFITLQFKTAYYRANKNYAIE